MRILLWNFTLYILILLILVFSETVSFGQACDPSTPSFTFDLSGNPDSVWISPNVSRVGLCCGLDPTARPPIRCIEFFFTLDDEAEGIRFDIASGAIPPGALGYQINCGPMIPVGDMICLNGPGPHRLTFCKPGNNPNTYSITSVPKPKVSEPTVVSDACRGILSATGYNVSTIQWSSVPDNPVYNSYLSCRTACSTTVVTYQPGAPAYIDYQVSGFPIGGCSPTPIVNTTRVYFVNDKTATILPQDPVICYGGTHATITAYGNGGAPPYKYRWSTGETTQSINVGVGTYWVEISDSTSCPTAFDTVTVTAFLSPITADAGPDVTSCANNTTTSLTGSVYLASGGIWSGGTGTYSPSNTSLSVSYTPTASEVIAGSVRHILTTTGNRGCPPSYDTVIHYIVPAPIVNAGPDKVVCGNNPPAVLNGTVQHAGGGIWSNGNGTFSPSTNSLDVTYNPTPAEITNGSVTLILTSTNNGTCNPVSDQMVLTITPSPIVDAGPDISICANNAIANLSGNITGAAGGTWVGGSGVFSPNRNSLNATYRPSAAEISAGSVSLTLTSTGNGLCLPVSDQIIISITPAPIVNAGIDQTVCANNVNTLLNGTVSIASGGIWSGGNGIFSPSATSLNPTYTPHASEIAAELITLTLTSTGNGNCLPVSDRMEIRITPAPVVNAGPDISVCANNASASLSGTVIIAGGGNWSGGSGIFNPGSNFLQTVYSPTSTEISNGSVILTLTSTNNGNCLPVSDNMIVNITPAPIPDAGPDQSICANNAAANLSGSVTVATGGTWSGGTGTFSPNNVSLNTTYRPSNSEISNGSVTLTLTTTGNGNCLPVTDQTTLLITPAPTIDAGPDLSICANNANANLNGSVTIATGGIWSGGAGIFSPSNNLTSTYTPTATEINNGFVILTLTSTGNGNCLPVSDRLTISITPAPTINAGPDQTVCSDVTSVQLNGGVTISSGGQWSTSGSGSFDNINSLSTNYFPDPSDISSGNVTLTLLSIGNGNCLPVTDNLVLIFDDIPQADAGPDQTVCTNNFPVQLNPSGNAGTWSGGSGTFHPNANTMNATYTPSQSEMDAQFVTLTYTTISNGTCAPATDQVTITLPPGPTANAGGNRTVCADIGEVELTGLITNATGGLWSSSGTGTFNPGADVLVASYILSAADTVAGSVTLTLTTTGNIACNPPAVDRIVLTITPAPVISAGPDLTVCADTSGVQLSGWVTVAGGVSWSSNGTGSFSSSNDLFSPTYHLSEADTASRSVTLTITSTNNGTCRPVSDNMTLSITPVPLVNAGLDQTVCADAPSATLTGSVYNATGGVWSSSGSGVFSPNPYSLNAQYFPSAADRNAGTVNLFLTSTGNGNCRAVSESSLILSITPAPTANAGPDITVCADTSFVPVSGSLTVATTGRWTSNGSGYFLPNDSALSAQYVPSQADIQNEFVFLSLTTTGDNCINVTDQLRIRITPAPTINAGPDQSVCANNSMTFLNGNVSVASGGIWSGGNGTFSNTQDLNSVYQPSSSEILDGSTKLILSSTGNGMCKSVTDTMEIIITPAPIVDAGPNQTICKDIASVSLSASITVAQGGIWSTNGSGIFTPDHNSLNTTYLPTATDKADSTVLLILTSTGNNNCLAVSDSTRIFFTDVPTADAGAESICADEPSIPLNGIISVANIVTWTSSGSGSFSPSSNDLNANYIPSSSDRSFGSVKLFLNATTCKTATDSIMVYLVPVPATDAGNDQIVCANNNQISLNGTVLNATGGIWTTSGSGQFSPSNSNLNTTYLPSASDNISGQVSLILTSTGNENCRPGTDTIRINITPAPTVNAGPDQIVCADTAGVSLNGSVSIAGGGSWTSSGTGSFSPDVNNLSATYIPSSGDMLAGNITLTLTSTQNGNCIPVNDQLALRITPAPTINAGPDITTCEDINSVAFYGTVNVATGGLWSTNGNGTFNNSSRLQTIYTMTNTDRATGMISLFLTSTGNGTCKPAIDTVRLFITSLPSANAGLDRTVCNNNYGLNLSGSVGGGVNGGYWSTTGSGNFTPSHTILNATYIPSPSDTSQGNIVLTLTTDVIGGCAVFDTMIINFIDPKLNLPNHYCFENNLLIDSDPRETVAGGNFSWYMNNVLLSGQTNSTLTINSRGIYKVSYTFDACTVTDSTDVTYPVELTTSDKLICEGGSTILTTSIVPNATYQWSHNGLNIGSNSNNISVTDDGNPEYRVMVIDSLGCIARDTAFVNTIPPPEMTLNNTPSCIGQQVTLNASPSNNTNPSDSRYIWYQNGILRNDTTSSITTSTSGTYSVIYRLGECFAYDTSVVTFHPLPVSSANKLSIFCKETEQSVQLNAGSAYRYLWIHNGDTTQFSTVTIGGYYPVVLTNIYNCSITDSVHVKDICPPRLHIPTVFSPNGDGKNETFDVQSAYVKNYQLTIFNRWGEVIFQTNDLKESWDGYYRGEMMPVGVYAWIVSYEGLFDEYKGPYKDEGSVTIVR